MAMIFLFFLLCYVSYKDITKRKIFNHSVLCALVLGVLFLFFPESNGLSKGWSDSLTAAFVFFVLFLVFYRFGWMGAGDVKWGAALAFCLGLHAFFYVWLISVMMAIAYSQLVHLLSVFGMEQMKMALVHVAQGKKYVPYGALLSIAAMIFILGSPWS